MNQALQTTQDKPAISVQLRRECMFYWKYSKAIRLSEMDWEVLDIRMSELLQKMQMSNWLRLRIAELRALNAKRGEPNG